MDSADAEAPTIAIPGRRTVLVTSGGSARGGIATLLHYPIRLYIISADVDPAWYNPGMVIAALLLGLCQIVTTIGACLFIRRTIDAKQADIEAKAEAALRAWIDLQGENKDQPSKLALMLDSMGAVVGSAAARSLMNSMKQPASAMANVANGITEPMLANQNPLLAMLTTGKRGKGAAVLRLAEMLGGMLGKPIESNHSDASGSVRDRLR